MTDGVQASVAVVVTESLLWQSREPSQDTPAQEPPTHDQRTQERSPEDQLRQVMGDARTICRTIILDFTITNYSLHTLRMLEASGVWQLPETRVVVVGWRAGVETVLLHPTLRNTLHAFYFALGHLALHTPPLQGYPRLRRRNTVQKGVESEGEQVFRRCEYCRKGHAGIELLHHRWNLTFDLLHTNFFHMSKLGHAPNLNAEPSLDEPSCYVTPVAPQGSPNHGSAFNLVAWPKFRLDQLRDFMGHMFHILSLPNFPYMDYQRDTEEPGTRVTPKDSLAVRVLYTLASALNFTYDIREQSDRVWGLQQANGSFNGLMGNLEREETDFCILIAPTPGRLKAMGYSGAYVPDVLSVTSLKPTLLPQHLVLLRPFAGELWLVLLVNVVLWSVMLWLLYGMWHSLAGGPRLNLTSALLYGCGVLLETSSQKLSLKISGKVLVGWWLVHCLIICTAFRSSLVAHLTVQGRTRPLETLQDLVEQDSWGWGTEPWVLTGLPLEYFSRHTDPVVRRVYDKMQLLPVDAALQRVLAKGFSFINFRNYISVIVATRYTDAQGHTPFYISKDGVSMTSSFGWGFRRGAPFQSRFSQMIQRLQDTGIIGHWKDDVMARRVREKREEEEEEAAELDNKPGESTLPQGESQAVLGLQHLQGAFYFLLLGHTLALLTLLGENLGHSLLTPQQPQENLASDTSPQPSGISNPTVEGRTSTC